MTTLSHRLNSVNLRQYYPWIALLMGIIAGTFAAPLIKLTQQAGLPSAYIAFGRMGLAAVILSPIVLRYYRSELRQLTRRDLLMAMMGGLWLQIHFQLLILALESTSVLIVLVMVNTAPLWVAFLERVFLKEQINRFVWLGMFFTIFGSSYIAFSSSNTATIAGVNPLYGATLSVLAAIASSGYMIVGRSVRRKVSLFPYIWIVFGFGGIVGLIIVLVSGTPLTGHPTGGYFWLLMLTLIPQLIGHSSFNFALGYLSATLTSLSGQLITVTAAGVAFFMFAEIPGRADIIGSAIILIGVLVAILNRPQKTK